MHGTLTGVAGAPESESDDLAVNISFLLSTGIPGFLGTGFSKSVKVKLVKYSI